MGLLDSVLGAVVGGGQQASAGAAGGLGSLLGMLGGNSPMVSVVASMLGNDSAQGGLGGLMSKFQQAGMGDVIGSWVGSGENKAISPDQLTNVLGSDAIAGMAQKMGINPSDMAGQLSQILPGLVDHLTPNGQAPAGGLGNAGDLMGMLGGLLKK